MAKPNSTEQPSEFPKTSKQRRVAYRQILALLRSAGTARSITGCRVYIEKAAGHTRRPCDTRDVGTWLPQFALNAIATTLKDAERELAAERRRMAAHG